jgi:hypothetical protein
MYLKFKIRPAIPDWLHIFFPGAPLPTPKSPRKTKKVTEKRGLVGGYEKKYKEKARGCESGITLHQEYSVENVSNKFF